jgi:glycosyltransferase involved in cell wall biosynthesis
VNLFAPIMRALGNGYELIFTGGSAVSAKERAIFPSNMRDIGRLDEPSVIDALRSAHVLLFPSRSEGFGLVAAEAMACGLPVIACRNTALEDLVEHKVTGFLCSTEEISCFVDSIRSICNDPALYQKQSQAARQIALASFSIQKMVDEYAAEYQKLCAK